MSKEKRFIVFDPNKYPSSENFLDTIAEPVLTNWALCFLCQRSRKEKLISPVTYSTLVQYIMEFQSLNLMPIEINVDRINEGHGILETLQKNNAKCHKSCSVKFNKTKLNRAKESSKKRKLDIIDINNYSPVKARRNIFETPPKKIQLCIVCDKPESKKQILINARSFSIDDTFRSYAKELEDHKLMAKLSQSSDVIAGDVMYHKKCLTNLHNSSRDHKSKKEKYTQLKIKENKKSPDTRAFEDVTKYIQEALKSEKIHPIFKLSSLRKMYEQKLAELDPNNKTNIHASRLKYRLLECFPMLTAENSGKEVYLVLSKDIGSSIQYAIDNSIDDKQNMEVLKKAAKILRNDLFNNSYVFTGSFDKNCEKKAISNLAFTFVQMILEGHHIENEINSNSDRDHIAVVISELLHFNAVRRGRATDGVRHEREREMPLPIYLSMLIYGKTRSKDLINALFKLGLCVSYDRLLNVMTNMANTVCAQYHSEQVVCPPQLSKGIFTCGAVDNIDHNPSARNAKESLHGTAISIVQFPSSENMGEKRIREQLDSNVRSKLLPLPQGYTTVPSLRATSYPVVPKKSGHLNYDKEIIQRDLAEENNWLTNVEDLAKKSSIDEGDNISWSAYHANRLPENDIIPCNLALLPLFKESSNNTCMMSHAMKMVIDATKHVNPSQTPIIVADQPLFALCKQIQWTWPETLGEEKIVVMMGGLHIEMNLLKLLGDWLRGSGWVNILIDADITTTGRADAILSGSHVTRTRYAHQVTAAGLKILQNRAYQQYVDRVSEQEEPLSFELWHDKQCQEQPQYKYWAIALELELMILQYIRSIRERNFQMYIQSLLHIAPWLFALDHTNYARWLPVHIADMVDLSSTHPEVYTEFKKGNFAVQKTSKAFSAMSVDQCHEQMNKDIKGDGGAVGLTENQQALERWLLAGPEISRLVIEFENSFQIIKPNSNKHHEQNLSTQKCFAKDVKAFVSTGEEKGNMYAETSGFLLNVDSKIIMGEAVVKTVNNIKPDGLKQYEVYVKERLNAEKNKPLSVPISKNRYPLFNAKPVRQLSKVKQQLNTSNMNCNLIGKFLIAGECREVDLDNFFRHEIQAFPPSLSDNGQIRQGKKSDLLDCLPQCESLDQVVSCIEVKLIDGAALVHALQPRASKTFHEYVYNIFIPYIQNLLKSFERVDIIFDRYLPKSLKQSTREKRKNTGIVVRQKVLPSSPIRGNWDSFLLVEKNKEELFHYLAKCVQSCETRGKVLVSTYDESIVTAANITMSYMEDLQPCSHEEADTRIFLHAAHCAKQGYKKICIKTVDTDVVIIAISHFESLGIEELWIDFGTGNKFRKIPVHDIAKALGSKAKALMMFHALTGCDTVSSFYGKGKKSAWTAWMAYPVITNTFTSLLEKPEEFNNDLLDEIERFIIIMYHKTSTHEKVDEARKALFEPRLIENIPPTQAALRQHVKRAIYQAGFIWAQSLVPSPNLPKPDEWGYKSSEQGWIPYWTDLPDASSSCKELVKCGCKKGCRQQCKCRALNLPCTSSCKCNGDCGE